MKNCVVLQRLVKVILEQRKTLLKQHADLNQYVVQVPEKTYILACIGWAEGHHDTFLYQLAGIVLKPASVSSIRIVRKQ